MKFQLAINMERMEADINMRDVSCHTLEMVQMAEESGFEIAWAAEHHALEMTIAPNPFHILTWWGAHTDKIRLGAGVAVAAYWNPIKLAGEAALTDLYSRGRLEFGIGSGAYQREFDRIAPGLKQSDAWRYMNEMLPALRALWQGDYEHEGEYWEFPLATSVPKPVQAEMPVWIAARAPITFEYAVKQKCNIMSWPLTRPMAEAELYAQRLQEAIDNNPDCPRPKFSMMRHTAAYATQAEASTYVQAAQTQLGQFETLFKNVGNVKNGFPDAVDLNAIVNRDEYNADMLVENLMFGTPEQLIAKIKKYEAIGVDAFIYYASMGLGMAEQKKSLKLFSDEVIPAFS